jgi:phosphonopyruvate decarboxylase
MIKNVDAVRIIDEHRGEAVIVTTMGAGNQSFGLPAVTHRQELDLPVAGAMGKASSVALGLALAVPDRKVFVLDGDGSLVMNLGTLTTISNMAPENLYHFVFENGVYAVTGGQPIPAAGKLSFQGMAMEAGYAASFEFDDTEELATNIDSVLKEKGPVLVCLRTAPEIENTPVQFREKTSRTMRMAIEEVSTAVRA